MNALTKKLASCVCSMSIASAMMETVRIEAQVAPILIGCVVITVVLWGCTFVIAIYRKAPSGAMDLLPDLPTCWVNTPYQGRVVVTNDQCAMYGVTYSLTAGCLPPGLQLYPVSGCVYGKPTQVGSWSGTYEVEDTCGKSTNHTFTIAIVPQPKPQAATVSSNGIVFPPILAGHLNGSMMTITPQFSTTADGAYQSVGWSLQVQEQDNGAVVNAVDGKGNLLASVTGAQDTNGNVPVTLNLPMGLPAANSLFVRTTIH